MDVNKHVSLEATHPSFDMGFERSLNGAIYLFGESAPLIKQLLFMFFPPCSGWQTSLFSLGFISRA